MNHATPFPEQFDAHPLLRKANLVAWLSKQSDRLKGFWERRRKGPPSAGAWEEMLSYYEGLYQERAPDPERFMRLLRRCGVPQCPNPFPEGEAQHFFYHPDLLVMADLEAVLNDLVLEWSEQDNANTPSVAQEVPLEPLAEDEWPDVGRVMRLRELELARQSREWSRLAGVCWALVLLDGQSLAPLKDRVHKTNLGWATIHAWRTAPLAQWGLSSKDVLNAAQAHGILSAKVVKHLLDDAQAEIDLNE